MTLRWEEYHFFRQSVDDLSHLIRPDLLEVSSKNMDPIAKAKLPHMHTEARLFLGFFKIYQRFVTSFAIIAVPLTEVTS